METLDGQRGSSVKLKNQLLRREINLRSKEGEKLNDFDIEYAQKAIAHQVMMNVATKFNIMRVRMKLSYTSYDKGMTIVELWIKQILKSMKFMQTSGQIEVNTNVNKMRKIYEMIIDPSTSTCMQTLVEQYINDRDS